MPLGLSGGYAAGGMNDTLFQLAKQRLLEQELAQRAQEAEYQRLRVQRQDALAQQKFEYEQKQDLIIQARQKEQDALAKETRDRQNAQARVADLTGKPQDEINATLGSDPSSVQMRPVPTGKMPGPAYTMSPMTGNDPSTVKWSQVEPTAKMPGTAVAPTPMLSNRIDLGNGVKVRPMSMEAQDERARLDEQRKMDEAVTQAMRLEEQKPPNYDISNLIWKRNGLPVAQNAKTNKFYQGQREVPPEEVAYAPTSSGIQRTASGLTPNQEVSLTNALTKQYATAMAPVVKLQAQRNIMHDAIRELASGKGTIAGASEAIIITFERMMDADSVVRESEFLRPMQMQALKDQIKGYIAALRYGGPQLTKEELVKYATFADQIGKTQSRNYALGQKNRIGKYAAKYGIPEDIIFAEYPDDPELGPNYKPPAADEGGGPTGTVGAFTYRVVPPKAEKEPAPGVMPGARIPLMSPSASHKGGR